MSAEPSFPDRRPVWRILQAMRRELRRQALDGGVQSLGEFDDYGRLELGGRVDLASLADATERALKQEFR